jgi:hypothetical protein
MSGWIGVDLDGTLAEYHGWGSGAIGKPVPLMVERVKRWHAEGKDVRIFTARVSCANRNQLDAERECVAVQIWCLEHLGFVPVVTCEKDYRMIELWDGRCHPVQLNTGIDLLKEEP